MRLTRSLLFALPILLCLIFSIAHLTMAQTETATISGHIVDSSGAIIRGAAVELRSVQQGTSLTTSTNEAGIYLFPAVQPGQYSVTVRKQGFRQVDLVGVVANVQDHIEQNFRLELGSVSESVTVSADQNNINTTDASVSTVIDRQFAENLPLNGRSFQSLIYLTPGVTLNLGGALSFNGNGADAVGQFTVDGQRASSNYWMVDGVSANIGTGPLQGTSNGAAGALGAFNIGGGTNGLVSVDAMQEFRIQTSTYAPEFGRMPGGQISITTRSGTNQFHGALFEYLRNTVFDAKDWFANHNGLPKAPEQQNDFGGVLGGPIIKDKSFFFFSYEGQRVNEPQTYLTTVPDLNARQSSAPSVQPFIDAYPVPNGPEIVDALGNPEGLAEFNSSFANPYRVDAYSLRVDHNLQRNLNLFGRLNYSLSSAHQRGEGGLSANQINAITLNTTTGTVGATWTASPKVVDEMRFNYSTSGGADDGYLDNFGGGSSPPGATLLPGPFTLQDSLVVILPTVGTNMEYYQGRESRNVQHQYNVVDTLSIQKGPHTLKFGVDYRRLTPFNSYYQVGLLPLFASISDFAAGNSSSTLTFTSTSTTFRFQNLGAFLQDTWHFNHRLTLTYGLRWDVDFAPGAETGPSLPALTGFSLTNLSRLALAPSGTPAYSTQYGNVAPRIGGAYQISQSPDWALVLRGGFGVYYDLAGSEVGNFPLYEYPYGSIVTFANAPFPTPASDATRQPILPPNAEQGTLQGFDPNLKLPHTLEWDAALEQALGKNQTLTASYVGSSGRRLLLTEDVQNPNPSLNSAIITGNAGSSNYDALQLQFQRRLSSGLQALVSYTWAHSIDTGSYGNYYNGSFANAEENKGSSDFDIRNSLSAALTYYIPTFKSSDFTGSILGGWSVDNIIQVRSASPVDVMDEAFTALTKQNSSIVVRPDIVSNQPLYLFGPQYPGRKALNPSAFTNPPLDSITGVPTRQGDLARNSLRGFGLAEWDFAVHREFPLYESAKLQFRAEMFNLLNRPNFGPIDTDFNPHAPDPYFGQATQLLNQSTGGYQGLLGSGSLNSLNQIGGPRSIQLALKIVF